MSITNGFGKRDGLNACIFFVAICCVFFFPGNGRADISVDAYCQLVIEEMEQQISNYQELIALANLYQDDPITLAQQETVKRAQFDQEKQARYEKFGTSAEEYVLYMGENGLAVSAYLEENPDIKQQMGDLKTRLTELSGEHGALKEAIEQPPPPLLN